MCVSMHEHTIFNFKYLAFAVHPDAILFVVSWFTCQVLERRRLQKRLSSCPRALESDVERSAESDMAPPCDGEPKAEEDATSQSAGKEEPVKEQDLQAQVCV